MYIQIGSCGKDRAGILPCSASFSEYRTSPCVQGPHQYCRLLLHISQGFRIYACSGRHKRRTSFSPVQFPLHGVLLHRNQTPLLFHLNKAGISSLLRPRRNRLGSWCHGGYIQIPFLPSTPAGAACLGTCVPTPGLGSSHPLIRHRYFLP